MTELILGFVLGALVVIGIGVHRRMKAGDTAWGALMSVFRGGGQGEERVRL